MSKIKILPAKRIITMNSAFPEAEAVAVKEGRILALGTLETLKGYGKCEVDTTFSNMVLIPGFIEAHSHIGEGTHWAFPYIGFYDRVGPDGTRWPGVKTFDDVLSRLRQLNDEMADPNEPLVVWGFDPIFFDNRTLDASSLDPVSGTRPIFVLHVSDHLASVNSALMKKMNITRDTDVMGVIKKEDGEPSGELHEPWALMLAGDIHSRVADGADIDENWMTYGIQAKNAGCTTIGEMAFGSPNEQKDVDRLIRLVDNPDFPVRVVQLYLPLLHDVEDHDAAARWINETEKQSTPKLRMGIVKYFLDGSIQGFTARLNWPGYHNGKPNGIFVTPPEEMASTLLAYHRAGVDMHCHCNGDEAVDVFMDAVEAVQSIYPRPDHRHTIHHSQLTSPAQYRRMAKLGICVNIFSNHIYYWGDQHYTTTVGPDRAQRMDACRTAKEAGVHFSLHCDAPITPISSLHTAWAAVNRVTASGRVLGESEKLTVYEALYANTLDAAYTLNMEHEIGSIEPGKLADFTVLEADPFETDPAGLKDIPVWGTVLGGKPFPAA